MLNMTKRPHVNQKTIRDMDRIFLYIDIAYRGYFDFVKTLRPYTILNFFGNVVNFSFISPKTITFFYIEIYLGKAPLGAKGAVHRGF